MKAYAVFDTEVGYLQSMNVLAAYILMVLDYDEELAFYFFIYVMQNLELNQIVNLESGALNILVEDLKEVLNEKAPEVKEHIEIECGE